MGYKLSWWPVHRHAKNGLRVGAGGGGVPERGEGGLRVEAGGSANLRDEKPIKQPMHGPLNWKDTPTPLDWRPASLYIGGCTRICTCTANITKRHPMIVII